MEELWWNKGGWMEGREGVRRADMEVKEQDTRERKVEREQRKVMIGRKELFTYTLENDTGKTNTCACFCA